MLQHFFLMLVVLFLSTLSAFGQQQPNLDSLKYQILSIQSDVEHIHFNLEKSKSRFQRGILVATLGYTVTIAGGLMLGRENDKLGQGLLVAGGVTGVVGTYMLVDAFKFLGRTRKRVPLELACHAQKWTRPFLRIQKYYFRCYLILSTDLTRSSSLFIKRLANELNRRANAGRNMPIL